MTEKKDNHWKKSKVNITRTKGIWWDLLMSHYWVDWDKWPIQFENGEDYSDIKFDSYTIDVPTWETPSIRWIKDERVRNLEVEIVWVSNNDISPITFLSNIETANNQ